MISAILFISITLVTLFFFYKATGNNRLVLTISIGWLLLSGVIALSGFFKETTSLPPRFVFLMIPAIILFLLLYRRSKSDQKQMHWIWLIHAVRLPVEIGLYLLYQEKKVPVLMTFDGWNFDILSGISAVLILLWTLLTRKQPSRLFLWCWNIMTFMLLVIIVGVAILSAPFPFQQLAFDQPNLAVLEFPFVYLPGFIVPVVFVAHLWLFKLLSREKDLERLLNH